MKQNKVAEFRAVAKAYLYHEVVLSMKAFIQHSNVDCYEHSVYVAFSSYRTAIYLSKFVKLDIDSIVKGAMLHDFFLYDWHHPKTEKERFFEKHGFSHPKRALENAKTYFSINKIEEDIILKHMWPLNIAPPKTKEALLVTMVDKYCSLKEVVMPWTNRTLKKTVEEIFNQ